ncbi:MAG: SDR family oxidoreductase [Aquihabitans sp.]
MDIAVVGATGRTGSLVVEQGLARGHHMTALARRPEAIELRSEDLVVTEADVLDADRLVTAVAGCQAVVSALGIGTSRKATVVYSEGTKNLLRAMEIHGISKLVVISAAPVGPRAGQAFLERRVMMPVLERLFGETYEDMDRMETLLRASDVDWVSLRPPRLVAKPATGHYRISVDAPLPRARSLTYADLATAMLDSLDRKDLHRHAAFVAN